MENSIIFTLFCMESKTYQLPIVFPCTGCRLDQPA